VVVALLHHLLLQTFAVAIALPTSVAVLMLLIWHVRMVLGNKTTIEYAEVRSSMQAEGVSTGL
jgi:hypothetical protein